MYSSPWCITGRFDSAQTQAAERAIDKQIVVAAPIESVWTTWTTKAGIESFFAPEAQIDAVVGGAFRILYQSFSSTRRKGADDMRFLVLYTLNNAYL